MDKLIEYGEQFKESSIKKTSSIEKAADLQKAMGFYKKAAELGSIAAKLKLAMLYMNKDYEGLSEKARQRELVKLLFQIIYDSLEYPYSVKFYRESSDVASSAYSVNLEQFHSPVAIATAKYYLAKT